VLFLLGCAAGSAWPVLNLYALVLRQDTPALLRQVDLRGVQPGLLAALRRHAGLEGTATAPGRGTGAEALLAAMSEDMATALSQPGALAQLALAREGMDIVPLGGVAAPPLQAPMLAGRGALSLDLGVALRARPGVAAGELARRGRQPAGPAGDAGGRRGPCAAHAGGAGSAGAPGWLSDCCRHRPLRHGWNSRAGACLWRHHLTEPRARLARRRP
jgi:hypothetical protein